MICDGCGQPAGAVWTCPECEDQTCQGCSQIGFDGIGGPCLDCEDEETEDERTTEGE